jgi:hypothetical protein
MLGCGKTKESAPLPAMAEDHQTEGQLEKSQDKIEAPVPAWQKTEKIQPLFTWTDPVSISSLTVAATCVLALIGALQKTSIK